MYNVSISLAEKEEILAYLQSPADAKVIPESYNINPMKRQCFRRLCQKFSIQGNSLLVKAKDESSHAREVICIDEIEKRQRVIALSHADAHHGVKREYGYISARYAGITREHVAEYIKGCLNCMKFEPIPKSEPLIPISAKTPFERVQMDLIDLKWHQTKNRGFSYIINLVDCFSRYCFTKPVKEKSAEEVLKFLTETFETYGYPSILQTDNGKEFKNSLVANFCSANKIRMVHGRPRHPQSQGKVERLNQTLARSLGKCCDGENGVWIDKLAQITKRYNLSKHAAFNETPFRAFFGRNFLSCASVNSNEDEEIVEADLNSEIVPESLASISQMNVETNSEETVIEASGNFSTENIGQETGENTEKHPDYQMIVESEAFLTFEESRGKAQSELNLKNSRYSYKMIRRSSVHAKKSVIEIGDEVIIKDDHDMNPGTRKRKLKPLNSRLGIVKMLKGNNTFEVQCDSEVLYLRSNQLKKIIKKKE